MVRLEILDFPRNSALTHYMAHILPHPWEKLAVRMLTMHLIASKEFWGNLSYHMSHKKKFILGSIVPFHIQSKDNPSTPRELGLGKL